MTSSAKSHKPTIATQDYLKLASHFVPRPLRSKAEHKAAMRIVHELMAKPEDELSEGESDYLSAMARFVSDYEREHFLADLGEPSPLEVLQHLMESRDMSSAELGDVLGSRSAATMILKGQREMSKTHIRAAAKYFAISPAVFI